MAESLIFDPLVDWEDIGSWSEVHLKGKSLHDTICRLCLGATIYHLWRHRNDLLHGNTPCSEELLVQQVKWEVRSRLIARCSAKRNVHSRMLVRKWNLQQLLSV
jgi:hypothetical protein